MTRVWVNYDEWYLVYEFVRTEDRSEGRFPAWEINEETLQRWEATKEAHLAVLKEINAAMDRDGYGR